jgi:hypothetical protein
MKTVTVVQTADTTTGTCNPQDFFLSYEFTAKKLMIVACARGSALKPELVQVSVDGSTLTSGDLSQLKTHLAKIVRTKPQVCSAKSDLGEQVSIESATTKLTQTTTAAMRAPKHVHMDFSHSTKKMAIREKIQSPRCLKS